MDFSEKWGTDVETAVNLALEELKATRDEVNITVLEEPSRGFFGIGSKLALVRVERKNTEKEKPVSEEVSKPKEKEIKKAVKTPEPAQPALKQAEQAKPKETVPKAKTNQGHSGGGSRQKNDFSHKRDRNRNDRNNRSYEDIESVLPIEEELVECSDHVALTFLKDLVSEMGLDVQISAKKGTKSVYLNIQGKDSSTIIGKRGQTLDAIQYLTSLVANKEDNSYTRVVVDAENYRRKREKTLILLANRLAGKVVKTRRYMKLEPMNPYERKVIHATLQNNPRVTTRSEGEEPYRRVIIELK